MTVRADYSAPIMHAAKSAFLLNPCSPASKNITQATGSVGPVACGLGKETVYLSNAKRLFRSDRKLTNGLQPTRKG
jgi:hypothetical protein